MTLICILIGFGLEFYLGNLDQFRNFDWFDRYCNWLESCYGKQSFWNGPWGVALTLIPPLLILFIIGYLLAQLSTIVMYFFILGVFIYNLGPSINFILNPYLEAMEAGNESLIRKVENDLIEDEDPDNTKFYQSVLIRAHDNSFGALLWFIVLGILGITLFSLVIRLKTRYTGIHGDYSEAVLNLYKILIWPSSRLLALSFALGGSLVDAAEGWRSVEGISLDNSHQIIINSGLGAIQHRPDDAQEPEGHLGTVQQLQALMNRSLIVWLTVLGVMTIGGWLS